MRKNVRWIGATGAVLIAAGLSGCGGAGTSAEASAPPAAIGQPVQLGKAQITVEKVSLRDRVGIQYAYERAPEGAVLVVVEYAVKNTSTKPMSAFEQPQVRLVDGAGVEYSPDVGKSAAFAMERDDSLKAWSDLNPGVTVRGAQVFEVAKDQFNPTTWLAAIDGEKVRISLAKPA